jgi:hypothetical protein
MIQVEHIETALLEKLRLLPGPRHDVALVVED